MKKIIFSLISLSIGIGLLVWVISFIGWQEIKSVFLIFTIGPGIAILFLTVLMLLTGVWKWKIILKNQGENVSNQALIKTYLAGFAITYLLPMLFFGGEVFRAYVLKERYSVAWKKAMSSVVIDRISEVTAYLITIFAGLIIFLLKIGLPPKNLGIILAGSVLFFSASIGFFYFKSFRRESIVRGLAKFLNYEKILRGETLRVEREVFDFLKLKKKILWKVFALAFLRVIITWLRIWVLIFFLGKSIGILSALSILSFYYFVIMIPIPAALGSHELIQTFSFSALGLGSSIAPAFTIIQRGVELIMALVGLIIFFKLGLGLFQGLLLKKLVNLIDK